MDLFAGEAFGEDYLCYSAANTYSAKVESTTLDLLIIDKSEFQKKYKRMV